MDYATTTTVHQSLLMMWPIASSSNACMQWCNRCICFDNFFLSVVAKLFVSVSDLLWRPLGRSMTTSWWSMALPNLGRSMAAYDPYGDPDSITHTLDYSHDRRLHAKVRQIFSTPVNPISSTSHFFPSDHIWPCLFPSLGNHCQFGSLLLHGGAYDSL
jgi:hypothetical protein